MDRVADPAPSERPRETLHAKLELIPALPVEHEFYILGALPDQGIDIVS
jgi:hypothetical protein